MLGSTGGRFDSSALQSNSPGGGRSVGSSVSRVSREFIKKGPLQGSRNISLTYSLREGGSPDPCVARPMRASISLATGGPAQGSTDGRSARGSS